MIRTIVFWLVLLPICVSAQTGAPSSKLEQTVSGQTLHSPRNPAVSLTFDQAFKYVGGERFVLYNVANAEIHLFVNADEQRNITRMFWVQFEGYLPNVPHTYNYRTKKTAKFGPMEFMVDVRPFGTPDNPESDGGHVKRLLESKGYKWPTAAVRARFIYLPNPNRRSELMIIYVEDAKYAQVPPDDLANWEADQRWPEISRQLVVHAQRLLNVKE
jgi:hypothetical protein